MSCLRRSEFVALPELEGVGAALRLSYPGMDTTGGHAVINGLIWSRLACRTWSCTQVGAPARPAALVPGIDCGADPVGQTWSGSSTEQYCVTSESWTHGAPLNSTPLTTPQRASQGPRQPTCSAPIGLPTVIRHSDPTQNIMFYRAACENGA